MEKDIVQNFLNDEINNIDDMMVIWHKHIVKGDLDTFRDLTEFCELIVSLSIKRKTVLKLLEEKSYRIKEDASNKNK